MEEVQIIQEFRVHIIGESVRESSWSDGLICEEDLLISKIYPTRNITTTHQRNIQLSIMWCKC